MGQKSCSKWNVRKDIFYYRLRKDSQKKNMYVVHVGVTRKENGKKYYWENRNLEERTWKNENSSDPFYRMLDIFKSQLSQVFKSQTLSKVE